MQCQTKASVNFQFNFLPKAYTNCLIKHFSKSKCLSRQNKILTSKNTFYDCILLQQLFWSKAAPALESTASRIRSNHVLIEVLSQSSLNVALPINELIAP